MTGGVELNFDISIERPIYITFFFSVIVLEGDDIKHVEFSEIEAYKECLVHNDALKERGISILNLKDDCFFLVKDNQFLSARPDGTFGTSFKAKEWENFIKLTHIPFNFLRPKPYSSCLPKIIHQTDNDLVVPHQYHENIGNLKDLNPGWEYRYYSEKGRVDFIYEHYGWEILRIYLRINRLYGASQADFFRYLCLYQYGGVYFDMKSGGSQAISSIVQDGDEFVISQWDWKIPHYFEWGKKAELSHVEGGEYPIWCLICSPGHPLMKKVIDQMIANIFLYTPRLHGTGSAATLKVTGPILFTRVVHQNLNNYNIKKVNLLEKGFDPHMVKNIKREYHYHEQVLPLVIQSAFVGSMY